MNIPISRKVFVTSTALAFSGEVFWFVHENAGVIEWPGIPLYLAECSPMLVSAACAVSFVVAVLHGLAVVVLGKRIVLSEQLKLDTCLARWVLSVVLGGCLSTALIYVLGNEIPLTSLGGPELTWTYIWTASSVAIFSVQMLVIRLTRDADKGQDRE